MVFPELRRGVFSADSLQDLLAAGVFIYKLYRGALVSRVSCVFLNATISERTLVTS